MPLTEWIVNIASALVGATLLLEALLLVRSFARDKYLEKHYLFSEDTLPVVSVLVAARNEALVLRRCLDSLIVQDYPAGKLEILVGNDDSEDATAFIINEYESNYPFVKGYQIAEPAGAAKGKANVLAQLAKASSGEVLLITDADMWLTPGWCQSMVLAFTQEDGIVTGYTAVAQNSFFGRMQSVDWALAIGMIKVLADLGLPVTSMGNNMAVLTKAYQATGGYENLPFSITEDFQLTRQVLRKGYNVQQLVEPPVCGITLPAQTLSQLLQQRRRWMRGVVQLPLWIILLLVIQALYFPFAIAGFLVSPWFGMAILIKLVLQTAFCVKMTRKAGVPLKIADSISYEIYSAIISLLAIAYLAIPGKISWKGRTYF